MNTAMKDKIDELSDRWFARYPKMRSGPWQVWGRMVRINETFLTKAGASLEACGLSYREFQTLGALVLSEDSSVPKQIASFSMLTSGGTANILKRLEKKELITRKQGVHDKREVIVELTDAGRDLFETALTLENAVEHKMLDPLTESEKSQLINLLRKLTLEHGL